MARKASISKRADGNYCRSIVVGRKPDGKPIRKYIYARTVKELEAKAAEYERQLQHGTLSSDEKLTFGELARVWLDDYKPTISLNTRKKYTTLLSKHLLPELELMRLKDLKPHHLQSIINRLASDGYAEATLKEVKGTAVQILDIALDNDVIARNTFAKVTIPHIEAEERRALTNEERALIERTYQEHRIGIPAMIMLYCGLRRGELIALQWGDIDLKGQRITINKAAYFDGNKTLIKPPKTKAGNRAVPIPATLIEPLHNARRAASSVMVCPAVDGSIMSQIGFKRAWESYMHFLNLAAGGSDKRRGKNDANGKLTWIQTVIAIDNITPHMLRHTYASMLYDAGVDVKSAQRFMGHANIEITLRVYTHLSQQKEEQAIEAINNHFAALPAAIVQ